MPLAWPALLTQEDGNGATKRNTHVSGGDSVTVFSGDASIKGAVIAGGKVIADIGGDLDIESRQDTARFDSKSQSASMSGMAGWGPSVSASCSQSAIGDDFASVREQSGHLSSSVVAGGIGFTVPISIQIESPIGANVCPIRSCKTKWAHIEAAEDSEKRLCRALMHLLSRLGSNTRALLCTHHQIQQSPHQ